MSEFNYICRVEFCEYWILHTFWRGMKKGIQTTAESVLEDRECRNFIKFYTPVWNESCFIWQIGRGELETLKLWNCLQSLYLNLEN